MIHSERIRRLMERLDLSAGQVSYRAGFKKPAPVYRLLNDERPKAQAITVAKVAHALDTSCDYLMGLTEDPSPPNMNYEPSTEYERQVLEEFRKLKTEDDWPEAVAQLAFTVDMLNRKAFRIIGSEPPEEK